MEKESNRKYYSANRWIAIFKGLMLIVFGIWLLKAPAENLAKLSIVFGILIIIGGLFEVWQAFGNKQKQIKWEWSLTSGILDILLGAFLVANPEFILWLITILVSLWLLFRGILAIRLSILLKKSDNPDSGLNMVLGIILILLALIFIWHPQILGLTIGFWTAIAFISLGIFRIFLTFKYGSVSQ
jgi:uncharacterized membrane protein HdeD (DUF308 family)